MNELLKLLVLEELFCNTTIQKSKTAVNLIERVERKVQECGEFEVKCNDAHVTKVLIMRKASKGIFQAQAAVSVELHYH